MPEFQENTVKISEEVIALIVEEAIIGVEGVYSLRKSKPLLSALFSKNAASPAVEIKVRDGAAEITAAIVVTCGCNARKVAEQVQLKVKDNVQSMAGLPVARVNVKIEDIFFEEASELPA